MSRPLWTSYPHFRRKFFLSSFQENGKRYPSSLCKVCDRLTSAQKRRENYADNDLRKVIQSQNKAYYSKPERKSILKEKNRLHYIENSAAIKKKIKEYRSQSINKNRRNLNWRLKYQEERSERRLAFKIRYHNDIEFRIRGLIRKRIHEMLKATGYMIN